MNLIRIACCEGIFQYVVFTEQDLGDLAFVYLVKELGEGSPEIERGGGERDRSLQASPTLDLSEGEEKGEKEKNPKGEKEKNPKVEEIKRKTTELKRKMRKATFDWNEGRYV